MLLLTTQFRSIVCLRIRSFSTTRSFLPAAVAFCLLATTDLAIAGQIGIDAFTDAAVVQDFEVLGPASQQFMTPVTIGGDIYTTDANILASSSKLGPAIGRSGVAIANKPKMSDPQMGFIEIELGEPTVRAGMYVGFELPWAATAHFFDLDNSLLGVIAITGSGRDSRFAAWQTESSLITRIRIVDTLNNSGGIRVDDFIREVSEPSSALLLMIATLAIASRMCRGIHKPVEVSMACNSFF